MKTSLLTVLVCATGMLLFTTCKKENEFEEFLASTEVQNKWAVLEYFSGVRCGYCPQGHQIAKNILNYEKDAIVIGIHTGSYANPSSGWANFTNEFGRDLGMQARVTGYPAGTINRLSFSNSQGGGMAMSRGDWWSAAKEIIQEVSPVNIGAKAIFNALTRELSIKVDVYYTSDGNGPNMLNVALLQNGIVAKQDGGGNNYVHNHVLRDFITGQWGDEIPAESTKPGSRYSKTFTYIVPEDYNGATIPPGGGEAIIEDMKLAVFIAENRENIFTGINVEIEIQ